MRMYLLAAGAAIVVASPAAAQTGGYFGIEGGVLFPKKQNDNVTTVFTQTVQTPAAGTAVTAPNVGVVGTLPTTLTTVPTAINGNTRTKFKRGYDVDAVAGYDFGGFRLEGELGYKRSRIKSFEADSAFTTGVATGLNPTGTTGTTFVFPVDNSDAFDLSNRVSVLSGMVNALLDLGGNGGPGFYAGGGIGRARVKMFGDRDNAWAYQGIAGVRFPVSDNVDIGLKYRYFRTGRLDFDPGSVAFSSTRTAVVPNVAVPGGPAAVGSTNVNFTRTATASGDFDNRFSSHSLLLSLAFNFGGAREEVLPPPPPPVVEAAPPPPPPPQTQTCPDGSVVLATDVCPVPPPPPPPPPPAPVRG
ncbi:hypothetical protein GCM10022280_08020 [Sphingomonas swuensis]|uniref:Msp4/OMP-like domain-containing protein n=1 Tax=Sphingomonas swuensis TaxID=977800 RepID=A0ABP7SJE6_9SPHN